MINLDRIEIVVGDITELEVDCIVNAANSSLLGGGGVDGAIHRAAGDGLYEECKTLGGCETGLAKITGGYDLAAKYVIHAVGPVWSVDGAREKLGYCREDVLLASCYHTAMKLASLNDVGTIAFSCISTGVYGFPKERAAKIALGHVLGWLEKNVQPKKVLFCCFGDEDAEIYHQAIESKDQWMIGSKRC